MNTQTIIEFLKKHKIIVGLGIAAILGVFIMLLMQPKPIPTQPVVTEPKPIFDTSTFKLLDIYPKQGTQSTIDSFEYLKFTFSKPVEAAKVVITVKPNINLKADVFEDKNVLIIRPEKDFWKRGIEYIVTLSEVTATDGTPLGKEIIYSYVNVPPTNIMVGEPR